MVNYHILEIFVTLFTLIFRALGSYVTRGYKFTPPPESTDRPTEWRIERGNFFKGQSHELRMCGSKLKTLKILRNISRLTRLKKMAAASGFGGYGGKRRN